MVVEGLLGEEQPGRDPRREVVWPGRCEDLSELLKDGGADGLNCLRLERLSRERFDRDPGWTVAAQGRILGLEPERPPGSEGLESYRCLKP